MDVPLHKYWGDMSPCPIGIDAPASNAVKQSSLELNDMVGPSSGIQVSD